MASEMVISIAFGELWLPETLELCRRRVAIITVEHIRRAVPPADVNLTHCGDHFSIYANMESLCCTSESNVICQLYLNVKKGAMHKTSELSSSIFCGRAQRWLKICHGLGND